MAKQDYIPRQDPDLITWFQNFKTEAAALGTQVGIEPAHITQLDTDFTILNNVITALVAAKANQQAATATKASNRQLIEGRIRAMVRRIKAHSNYTPAIGEQLGVVGPEDTTDLSTSQPTLKATSVQAGSVEIAFNKSISSGVKILSKRGAETSFTFLASDTSSPYVDNRANLTAGPETRAYQAQYLDADDPVGLLSDTLTVTVPG